MAQARRIVIDNHTFDARAARIMELVAEFGWHPETSLA